MSRRVIISVTNDLSLDQRVHRIATTLVENGWEVLLVGRNLPDSLPLTERGYEMWRMKLLFRKGKFFYLEYAFRLFWFLLFRKADVLLSNDMDTLLPNFLVARLRRKKLVYDSHEYWTEVPELIDRPRTRAIWLWLEKRLFPRVHAAYTVNGALAKIYHEKYGIPVGTIRNLPHRKEAPDKSGPGRLLIYQGTLNLGRGIDLMIDAMDHLPEYKLRIMGYGPTENALREKAKALGDRVEFTGFIPFDELHAETVKASLGLSLEEGASGNYQLASPNKLFDYVMGGVPALVSDLPEMAKVVSEYGVGETLSPEERSPEKLAERIRAICEEEEKWKGYRRACLQASGELCWENEEKRLLAIFEGL